MRFLPVLQIKAADCPQTLVELVDQGFSGWNFEAGNVLVGDAVEIFDEAAEAVSMGGDQRSASFHHQRLHPFLPKR